jgi:hypothetical protein
VTLRGKDKLMCKSRVPEETLDTWYDFPIIEFKSFVSTDVKSLALESRASGKCFVNDPVKLFDVVI